MCRPAATLTNSRWGLQQWCGLRFTFENLNLSPGSDTASIGFVQSKAFRSRTTRFITVIPNSAAVFLGYDAPGQTATVTHVVDTSEVREMILTDVSEPFCARSESKCHPNLFTSSIVFKNKRLPRPI
ncbi:MAG: hypothetical protein R2788_02610 [Saprospiraceae bacterium]